MDGTGDFYTIGGAGQDCSTQYTAYSADGAIVAQTSNPLNLWFSRPKDRDQVHGPGKNRAAPCAQTHVVGMTSLSISDALVVCSDGAAIVTSDSGRSWDEADELPGTMAVGSGGGRYWIAGTSAKCNGIFVRWLRVTDGELSLGPSRCAPASKVAEGGVAIDVSENAIWLWSGMEVRTSTDDGESWS